MSSRDGAELVAHPCSDQSEKCREDSESGAGANSPSFQDREKVSEREDDGGIHAERDVQVCFSWKIRAGEGKLGESL